MPSNAPRQTRREVTLPQVLALVAIWTAVIIGLASPKTPNAEQISLKGRTTLAACAPQG